MLQHDSHKQILEVACQYLRFNYLGLRNAFRASAKDHNKYVKKLKQEIHTKILMERLTAKLEYSITF